MSQKTPWLTQDELATWLAWLRLSSDIPSALHRQLQRESGLTLQDYDVLVQLSSVTGGQLRISALAAAIHWERSRLSHHLKRMELRGLVVRADCDDDGRGNFVSISPMGRRVLDEAAPQHLAAVRAIFFEVLDDDDQAALRRLTEKLLRHLADHEPDTLTL